MGRFNNRYKRDMKQTAVEWLVEQLDGENHLSINEINRVIEQAKEMEKEQIIDAYNDVWLYNNQGKYNPEQYYNETFKSE
jgi:HEPN domain-containing protein